jgi:hypothetical protein
MIKECNDCGCIFVAGMFCYDCGSANVDLVSDDLPFK